MKLKMGEKGFTLLELIIAMALITMVMAAVFMGFSVALRLFVEEMDRSNIYIEADRGISRMTKELLGAKEIVSASSREVTFWLADVNADGLRQDGETVRFAWEGTAESALNRIVSSEVLPISYDVIDFTLGYDNPLGPKLINIELTTGKGTNFVTLESSVKLRNI